MRIHLGSDHAGFDLKNHLVAHLSGLGHQMVDHGPTGYDPADDYPPAVMAAAAATVADPDSLGIVIGGSGNGEAMAANKIRGARCALAWSRTTAELARAHNDANIVSLGARLHTLEEATGFVDVFLATAFTGEERHRRRLAEIADYERSGELPTQPSSG